MKNNVFIFVGLIICVLIIAVGCGKAKTPGIEFSSLTCDFGEVEQGTTTEYAFQFTNPGNSTLKIIKAESTCDCTVLGSYTREVAPGKTGYIPVVFNTRGYKGKIEKIIRIETNIPKSQPVYLTVMGIIHVYIVIEPNYIFLGNTVVDGPPVTGRTALKNFSDTPLEIVSAKLSGERSTVHFDPVSQGFHYLIEITEKGPFKLGQVKETLTLTIKMKEERVYEIPYMYTGTTDIEVIPEEITLFQGEEKGEFLKIFSVISHTDTLIEILNPEIHGNAMSFIINEFKPKKGYEIKISFEKDFVYTDNESYYFSFDIKAGSKIVPYTVPIRKKTVR